MTLTVFRNEQKFYISGAERYRLMGMIGSILEEDENNKNGGYFVRSVYFDSLDDECLMEKNAGVALRNKYRIRIYDPSMETAKLEIKQKKNNLSRKVSETIPRACAQSFIDGDDDYLSDYFHSGQGGEIFQMVYHIFKTRLYRPVVTIDYRRFAYFAPGTDLRLTFDFDLTSSVTDFDVFSPDMTTTPFIFEDRSVLEIKFLESYPEVLRGILSTIPLERMAISKYALGRRLHKVEMFEDN